MHLRLCTAKLAAGLAAEAAASVGRQDAWFCTINLGLCGHRSDCGRVCNCRMLHGLVQGMAAEAVQDVARS